MLGPKIRRLRELKGYSQNFMCEKLKVSQSTFSKWENGAEIPYSRLVEISEILQVTPAFIEGFDEKIVFNLFNNQSANGLVIQASQMSGEEKKLYETLIGTMKSELDFLRKALSECIKTKNKQT